MKRPYIPIGVTQQGRLTPNKMTERDLDHAQRARECRDKPMAELLLASGAMEGPYRTPHPARNRPVLRFFRALLKFL